MADWEEIKRLAADFQRTQASDTLQRISERNCIDIVKKLTELNLIELIYTCDGKEFITPSHLTREIEDEIYINGGRVHLHDLSTNLNVDYQHVENRCKELANDKSDEYNLIQGQIIHSAYKNTLGKQIYETMITTGQLSIANFAKSLDLPSEFLLTIVKEILPKIMDDFVVSPDERTYYTTDMMDRYKSIIVGTLTAITRPTTIASIMKKIDIPERLFSPIVDGLIKEGRIDASVENRLFIPAVYAREQNEWIDGFYSANSYIEYDVLSRKDIKQPKAFLKKKFPDGIQLKTCFVSRNLVSQVESLVEDCMASNGLVDISSFMPPSIQPTDIEQMLQDIFKQNKSFASSCLIFDQTSVCSLGYIATCKNFFNSLMDSRAREHLEQGKLINHFLGGDTKRAQSMRQSQSGNPNKSEAGQGIAAAASESKKRPSDTENRAQDKEGNEENNEPDEIATKVLQQEQQQQKQAVKSANKNVDFDMTPEDMKRDKRGKKSKPVVESNDQADFSDDEPGNKRSKGSKKVSVGGSQGREIRQRSTKKKYLPGNRGKNKGGDNSDDDVDVPSGKTPRSQRGRAARRADSPEPEAPSYSGGKSAKGMSSTAQARDTPVAEKKEPLVFMNSREIANQLKNNSRDLGEFPDELFESIAATLESGLNKTYESRARAIMDDYLRSQASRYEGEAEEEEKEGRGDASGEEQVDIIE